jgi:hypothetical protein
MRRLRPAALAALLLLAPVLAPAPDAAAGLGFLARGLLRPTVGSVEPDARGGYVSWLRQRTDKSIVQGFKVWFTGMSDATDATLWMVGPGELAAEEVGSFAVSDSGAGIWEVVVDSAKDDGAEVPLSAESVLRLEAGVLQVRVPGGDGADLAVLRAEIGDFRWRSLDIGMGGTGRRATTRLREPPEPVASPDAGAEGRVRLWRRRAGGSAHQGLILFARGLAEDGAYEVWMEDPAGTLVEVGEFDATVDGLGFWTIDSRAGDLIPAALGADDVRELRGRRIEVRQSGFTDPSLVALLPRLR